MSNGVRVGYRQYVGGVDPGEDNRVSRFVKRSDAVLVPVTAAGLVLAACTSGNADTTEGIASSPDESMVGTVTP